MLVAGVRAGRKFMFVSGLASLVRTQVQTEKLANF